MTEYLIGALLSLNGAVTGSMVFLICRKIGKDLHVSVHSFFFAIVTGFSGFITLAFTTYKISPLGI